MKVLNCRGSGSTTGVISGVNWVTANAVKLAVANMSLGGGVSTTLDNAVASSISSGVTYALAGYVPTVDGQLVVFAVNSNNVDVTTRPARPLRS